MTDAAVLELIQFLESDEGTEEEQRHALEALLTQLEEVSLIARQQVFEFYTSLVERLPLVGYVWNGVTLSLAA